MSIKVSVIIPVYNAEKYLEKCIESLVNQTLQECELIFVNDGSSDGSKKIIEKYKELYNGIILINQENQGVSMARNNGLNIAQGEYIGFVDADDFIESDMYEVLYLAAKKDNSDVLISNIESEIEGIKVITKYPFKSEVLLNKYYIEQYILPYFIKTDNLNTAVNKLYKNTIIKANNIRFPERITLGEDGIFNMEFFIFASNMKYINYTGYHYREITGSATRNFSQKDYFNRSLEVYKFALPKTYEQKICHANIQQLRAMKLINNVMSYIYIYFLPTNEISLVKRYKYIKKMIRNHHVREALAIYENEVKLGKYEKLLLMLIKRKSTIGLYFATTYSRLKNNKTIGGV
jgi:glycosyltransferase involved in cell wall biosynthesis